MDISEILSAVKDGAMTVGEAEDKIRYKPFDDLGYAMVDYNRELRVGSPEVIYCAGKTAEQTGGIAANMARNGAERVLATRADAAHYNAVAEHYPAAVYNAQARLVTVGSPKRFNKGVILVATGGTSDIPVAEEAALTAEFLGNRVERLYDVGVAGLHRVLSRLDHIKRANVVVAVAGMEGALASVLGGLTNKPVIAVPTSVGYGANFGGLAALLSMLNACASGVAVVNIDNGFGAGYMANNINRLSGVEG